MKIMIEIPKEFICDYEADRFEDCFQRFICDSKTGPMARNYERETAEMLIKAFKHAKEVIMCKGCRYFEESRNGWGRCTRTVEILNNSRVVMRAVGAMDYCSWGERKEDEIN